RPGPVHPLIRSWGITQEVPSFIERILTFEQIRRNGFVGPLEQIVGDHEMAAALVAVEEQVMGALAESDPDRDPSELQRHARQLIASSNPMITRTGTVRGFARELAIEYWPNNEGVDMYAAVAGLLWSWMDWSDVIVRGSYTGSLALANTYLAEFERLLARFEKHLTDNADDEQLIESLDMRVECAHWLFQATLIAQSSPEAQLAMRRTATQLVRRFKELRLRLQDHIHERLRQSKKSRKPVSRELLQLCFGTTQMAMMEFRLMQWIFEQADAVVREVSMDCVCQQPGLVPDTEIIGPIGAFHGMASSALEAGFLLHQSMRAYKSSRTKQVASFIRSIAKPPVGSLKSMAQQLREHEQHRIEVERR
ncbi:MAG TPA: hypothetical protein PLV25_03835, partial [Opitutales bacterium]|nr:hypothetical protein [Opitutales bacterium]